MHKTGQRRCDADHDWQMRRVPALQSHMRNLSPSRARSAAPRTGDGQFGHKTGVRRLSGLHWASARGKDQPLRLAHNAPAPTSTSQEQQHPLWHLIRTNSLLPECSRNASREPAVTGRRTTKSMRRIFVAVPAPMLSIGAGLPTTCRGTARGRSACGGFRSCRRRSRTVWRRA